jgi:hypothetical protein
VAVHVATAADFYVSGFGATPNDNIDDAAVSIDRNYRMRVNNSLIKAVKKVKN